jgi:glycosyltransferase involved in cell wall biosynthesis
MGRILQIHNEYLLRGGEDVVLESENTLLTNHGHEVRQFVWRNKDTDTNTLVGKLRLAKGALWGKDYMPALKAILDEFKPEVAHIHNVFPRLTPTLFPFLKKNGCRVVVTLHNYRLFCAGATLLRNGKACTLCVTGSKVNGIKHSCYRNSRLGSTTVVASMALHNAVHSWDAVDKFIMLEEFSAELFEKKGIPRNRQIIKHNSVKPAPKELLGLPRKKQIFFGGRISGEKGLDRLLEAWSKVEPGEYTLKIAGDGPLRPELMERFKDVKAVEWLGQVTHDMLLTLCAESRWIVIPSVCYETGGVLVGIEGMSVGTPLIVPTLGTMPSMIDNGAGILFDDQSIPAFTEALTKAMATNDADWKCAADKALERAVTRYADDTGYSLLMEAYGFSGTSKNGKA